MNEVNFYLSGRNVFHFNIAHNKDQSIPPWIIKRDGQTFYIHHLESTVGFRTKETPDNPATKGSLQFIGVLKIRTENGISTAYVDAHQGDSCY